MQTILLFLISLILLSPVTGELWRLPFLGFELLPSDILIPLFFVLWVLQKIRKDRVIRLGKIGKVIVLFMGVTVFTYLLNLFRFDFREMLVAATYMARFFAYMVLALITFDLLERDQTPRTRRIVLGGMIASMILIALLGFLQLKYFPSFLALGLDLKGWDPHIGRLLSTWFDPNFIGGYLAFILPITLAITLFFHRQRQRKWFFIFAVINLIGLVALYFTFSRSGYLAMLIAALILAFFLSRKLLIGILALALIGFMVSPRMQERVGEGIESAKAFIGLESAQAIDPSARLRLDSWGYAIEMIRDHPWIGVGYSRYAYEIVDRGHGMFSEHDVGGSDSSLLTLWATTGLFGLITYLGIGFTAFLLALQKIRKGKAMEPYLNAGLLAGFSGIMVHSIFVNSLLFPLIMVYLWVGLGLLDQA